MREIKFRAWDAFTKKMRYAYDDKQTFALDFNGNAFSYSHGYAPFTHWAGDGLVLMQFTGFKDANGKGIYEGDIVCWVDGDETVSVIEWSEGDAAFVENPIANGFDYIRCEQFEVIGNIYENQELLSSL